MTVTLSGVEGQQRIMYSMPLPKNHDVVEECRLVEIVEAGLRWGGGGFVKKKCGVYLSMRHGGTGIPVCPSFGLLRQKCLSRHYYIILLPIFI